MNEVDKLIARIQPLLLLAAGAFLFWQARNAKDAAGAAMDLIGAEIKAAQEDARLAREAAQASHDILAEKERQNALAPKIADARAVGGMDYVDASAAYELARTNRDKR